MINFLKQIAPQKLLDGNYIFQATPNPEGMYKYLGIIFVLLIIAALALKIFFKSLNPVRKKIINKIIYFLLIIGLSGIFWIFFRFEQIAYIGSRLILIVIILAIIIWGLQICFYWLIYAPKEFSRIKQKESFEKYLPRSKNKRKEN